MGILNTFKKKSKQEDKKEDVKKKVVKKEEKSKDTSVKPVKKEGKSTKDKKVKSNAQAFRVLVKPLITEKVTDMGMYNKYAFEITIGTNKQEVKKAVKEVYGVVPTSVNIVNMKGKSVRSGRVTGRTKKWKKAIITLKKEDKIEVYQGV